MGKGSARKKSVLISMNLSIALNYLKNHKLLDYGFQLFVDTDNNISLLKETNNTFLRLSVPYSKTNFRLRTPNSTIAFKELQKLWIILCHEAITKQLDFIVTPQWEADNYPSYTTMMYSQTSTPTGIIESKFNNLTIEDYFNLRSEPDRVITLEEYSDYLIEYYTNYSKPFFEAIPDLFSLDKLTNELDLYHLSLYLSGNGALKKILLMQLTNNSKKESFLEEYRNRLEMNKTSPNITPILASLVKIKDYFNINTSGDSKD